MANLSMTALITYDFAKLITGWNKMVAPTVTALKRWSCKDQELPPISQVKALHIYDFDNTLFMSPLPNPKLWAPQTIGFLQAQDHFANGGWWHDAHILEATGDGVEKEESRGWKGWWNEQIVSLVELSMKQKDALTVLLTGRGEHNFGDLIKRIAASKHLDFDMICLKQQVGPNGKPFTTTMDYKQVLLRDLIYTYREADEIRVYEDRFKHTKAFREFFDRVNKGLQPSYGTYNSQLQRKPIKAEVIQVADVVANLDPVIETAEVQRMINSHNLVVQRQSTIYHRLTIRRQFFCTGYLLSATDSATLLRLVNWPNSLSDSEIKFLANNIMISPNRASNSVLEKVGGLGAKHMWQVKEQGHLDHKLWAVRVQPFPPSTVVQAADNPPMIVLAHRKMMKTTDASKITNWTSVPTDKQYVFETVVGERCQLKVMPEAAREDDCENPWGIIKNTNFNGNGNVRKRGGGGFDNDDDGYALRNQGQIQGNGYQKPPYRGGNQNRGRGGGGGVGGDRGPSGGGGGGGGRNQTYPQRGVGRGGSGNRDVSGGRGGAGGQGNAGVGGGRNRGGRGGYKSLDDVGTNSPRYGGQGAGGYQNYTPNYDDGPVGNNNSEGYERAFPPMGGGAGAGRGNEGGLPYGH